MAKRAKTRQPVRGPEDYIESLSKMRTKLNSPDHKDYRRTIAGRGDTHALDGGKIPASKTKRGKKLKQMQKKFPPALPVWQDRNSSNQGTKLNP
jgi:hypothetical protein